MPQTPDTRACAARVLARVLGGSTLDAPLAESQARLPARERPLLAQLCYGTLRQAPRLQALQDLLLERPLRARDRDVQALILLGLYQLSDSRVPAHAAVASTVAAAQQLGKPWAKGLVNALLRRYRREAQTLEETLDAAARSAHPEWLYRHLADEWPQALPGILDAGNRHPPMSLRVNLARGSREAYLELLTAEGIAARPGQLSPACVYLDSPRGVESLPGFREGRVSVQDEGAQLAANWLDAEPGQSVLDACAAPGGKTCHILENSAGPLSLTAMDCDAPRLRRVEENLQRLGLQATVLCADARHSPAPEGAPFQRILVDAPCSASGVIRRHPDIKLLRRETDIAGFAAQQGDILDGCWELLADGGRLLYATCSVLDAENSAVIAGFLQRHANARERDLPALGTARAHGRQILPEVDGPDGLYYALLEKAAAAAAG
jgi:16S rRNA (cytosine967-C5)-methyltransferase